MEKLVSTAEALTVHRALPVFHATSRRTARVQTAALLVPVNKQHVKMVFLTARRVMPIAVVHVLRHVPTIRAAVWRMIVTAVFVLTRFARKLDVAMA